MSSFYYHTTNAAAAPFSCGEDRQQTALAFDGGAAGSPATHDLDWVFASVANDMVNAGVGLNGLEAASSGASNPGFNYPSDFPGQYNTMNTNFLASGPAPTPALTDSDTVASSPSDGPWGETDIQFSLPMVEPQGNAMPCSYSAEALPFQADSAWMFGPGQFAGLGPSYTAGDGPLVRSSATNFALTGTTSWGSAQINAPPFGLVGVGASQTISPAAYMPTLEHNHGTCGPVRRVKRKTRMNGVLEAAGSTSRARHKPATMTQQCVYGKSEAAGRGAEKLAATIAHEVYHQLLPGPSVQGGLMGTTVQGKPPWIEGSEGVTSDITGNVVGQPEVANTAEDGEGEQEEQEEQEGGAFQIPSGLSEAHQRFLKATPDERARGIVHVLKCTICPRSGFSNWEAFTRHCDRTEGHLQAFVFCRFCGDYFGRPDSRNRHEKHRPSECRRVSPAEAEEKMRKTLEVHEEFKMDMEAYLRFGVKIEENFSQRIKKLFPDSSKRGSRQQSRRKVRRVNA